MQIKLDEFHGWTISQHLYLSGVSISRFVCEIFSGVFRDICHWQNLKIYNFSTFSKTAQVLSHPYLPHDSNGKETGYTGLFLISKHHIQVLASSFIFLSSHWSLLSQQLFAFTRISKITVYMSLVLSALKNLVKYFCEQNSVFYLDPCMSSSLSESKSLHILAPAHLPE